jgi:hypothetical protein
MGISDKKTGIKGIFLFERFLFFRADTRDLMHTKSDGVTMMDKT